MDKIAEVLDKLADTKKHKCDSSCKYYEKAFEHNKKACVLSDVFSVEKGQMCSTYELKIKQHICTILGGRKTMTREQAKKEFNQDHNEHDYEDVLLDSVIDKIYDDIESRTCANCTYNRRGICYNSMIELMNSDKILVADDFGCRRWYRKK